MEDLSELTIATDRVDPEWVKKPLKWNIPFIKKFMLVFGLISSFFDFSMFAILLWLHTGVEQFRTGWFVELVVSATLIVLIIRTFGPFFKSRPSKSLSVAVASVIAFTLGIPWLPFAEIFGFVPIPGLYYLSIFALVLCYAAAVEFAKKIFFRKFFI
jgi:Mg2+-importing ATPase